MNSSNNTTATVSRYRSAIFSLLWTIIGEYISICNLQRKEILPAIGFTNICNCFASFAFMKGMTIKCHGLEGKKCDIVLRKLHAPLASMTALQESFLSTKLEIYIHLSVREFSVKCTSSL